MKLLQYVSAVGAMAHAPFLSSVSPEFMGLNSWTELPNIKDLMPSLKVRPTPNGAPCVTRKIRAI